MAKQRPIPAISPNLPRLTLLAELLETALPQATTFDLGLYYHKNSCETICCALGLAAAQPSFQAQGFTFTPTSIPLYQGQIGLHAAAAFFSISLPTCQEIFCGSAYPASPQPADVAEKVRNLINRSLQVLS